MFASRFILAGLGLGALLASPALAQRTQPKAPGHATPSKKKLAPRKVAPAASSPQGASLDATAKVLANTEQYFRLTPVTIVAGLPENNKCLAGQPLVISYSPKSTPLAGKAGIGAVVYYFDLANVRWVAHDIALHAGGPGELTATFTPPANVGFLALKFRAADGTVDNNHDIGYTQMMLDPAHPDQMMAGAYMGYGMLRKPDFGLSIPDYFQKFTISNDALALWMNQEIRFHPENAPALMPQFLGAIKQAQPTGYQARAKHALALATSQPNLTETDWLGCYTACLEVLENKPAADSLAQRIKQLYPNGYLVRQEQSQGIDREADIAKKQARWEEYLKAYPPTAAYEAPARYTIDYNRIYQNLILLNMATQKGYEAVGTYAPYLGFTGLLTIYYKAVQVSIRPNILTPAQALPNATLLMHRLDSLANHQPAEYAYLSPSEWQAYYDNMANLTRIHYAGLLVELGHYAEARPYAETAQRVAKYNIADLNDIQAAILHQSGPAEAAQLKKLLEASIYHNQASPRMLEWLRESYLTAHPDGAGYDQYQLSLQNPATRRAARAELAKEMFKKPIADFALRDLNGKLVRLSEQRGKTVVLDFWATWCVPCKASFPGMKLAQERFKNDPKVVFFFIDTEETEPDYKQQVRDFLTAKGFPFRVLFDANPPGAKTMDATYQAYCKTYKDSGIPQKLVVDPHGNLRFRIVGYKGSATGLADEIQNMVELARLSK